MALHVRIFIAAMLNPALKSRFMQEFSRFSRILAGFEGYKISSLENKNGQKIKKTLKTRFFIKIIKTLKTLFTSMVITACQA